MLKFVSLKKTLAVSGVALMAALAPAQAENIKLTILGVGDIYNFQGGKERGGFAKVNAVARAERDKHGNFLYLFDGDMFSPSLLSGLDFGANTVALTNLVPFDIAVPGNHEFDFGQDVFKQRIAEAKYPWAAINLTKADGSPIDGVGGVMVKEIAGLKVALIPVAQDTTPEVSSPGDWKFGPTADSAIAAAKQARKDGADLVIGVVQAPHTDDQAILKSHAFDVFVSGDDHDFALAYDGVTAYAETSIDGAILTLIDLDINVEEKDGKRTVKWYPYFRVIDTATVTADPESQKMVDQFSAKLEADLGVAIGTTTGPLDSRRNVVRKEESAMGNLIADAIKQETGADLAIMNGGGIRADKQYDAGATLTRKDILTELPFGNITVLTELTGADVLAALENGVSQVEKGAGRFPQVSAGVKLVYDPAAEAGKRIVSLTLNGEAIDPAKTYKVATNDYMLSGGDGFTALTKGKVLVDAHGGHLLATDVIDYVAAKKTIDEKVEGRITTK
ncbi:bifunctional metallophosphatase/5'-nucleotidase [Oryzibacter oryziterrae]|uniref:bifunctional metallophosphatase/5'-nucleotidase n=1 Tax=Oryzibacter oryziterrae TaxID=2766474 RepID=UPI001F214AC9|nr:bifunctional UDP-sugar hydrolase/5'-nucleotidase [Oryzibacter oryziterrae]